MGILLLGGLALYTFNKIKEVPRSLVPGMGVLPTVGLAIHDFLKDVEVPDLDDLIVKTGPQGSLSGIVHAPRSINLDDLIVKTGPQGSLSGIVHKKKRKKRKVKYHNLFEDEDPSIGPMADHPVEGDPGEDTHGFSPSPVADTSFSDYALGLFEDEDPSLGNYVEPMPKTVQTQPREIAPTNIQTWGYGMFEDQY